MQSWPCAVVFNRIALADKLFSSHSVAQHRLTGHEKEPVCFSVEEMALSVNEPVAPCNRNPKMVLCVVQHGKIYVWMLNLRVHGGQEGSSWETDGLGQWRGGCVWLMLRGLNVTARYNSSGDRMSRNEQKHKRESNRAKKCVNKTQIIPLPHSYTMTYIMLKAWGDHTKYALYELTKR